MDKNWKLQRYSRKDYSEMVAFPVEIVGRDGVVRRYSFEDSIRLYQRRISFASVRYRDDELVEAEVGHCRSRIVQLRRSYFQRYGWGTPEGEGDPQQSFGALAGEVAAFLYRVLRCDERPDVRFQPLGGQAGLTHWYLRIGDLPVGLLLQVHTFHGEQGDPQREEFFRVLKTLETTGRLAGDAERLVAFHHTADCGLVLTCQGDEAEDLATWRSVQEQEPEQQPTPWEQVVELVRTDQLDEALRRCRAMVEEQPWHRNAYGGGAVLATWLGRPEVAEDLALVGSHYFPDDALLHYQLGLARARLQRPREAAEALQRSVRLSPGLTVSRLLLVVLCCEQGQFRRARRVLRDRRGHRADDRRLAAILSRLEQWTLWRTLTVTAGLACVVLGIVATLLGGFLGLAPVVVGLTMSWAASWLFRRNLDSITSGHRFDDVHQGIRRLGRDRSSRPPAVS